MLGIEITRSGHKPHQLVEVDGDPYWFIATHTFRGVRVSVGPWSVKWHPLVRENDGGGRLEPVEKAGGWAPE